MDIDWVTKSKVGFLFVNEPFFFGKRAKRLFYIKSEIHSIFMEKHVQKVHFMFFHKEGVNSNCTLTEGPSEQLQE